MLAFASWIPNQSLSEELAVSELALCLDAFSKKQKASSDTVIY
jgi:hypothetical protein